MERHTAYVICRKEKDSDDTARIMICSEPTPTAIGHVKDYMLASFDGLSYDIARQLAIAWLLTSIYMLA